jgi:hypothetical protein
MAAFRRVLALLIALGLAMAPIASAAAMMGGAKGNVHVTGKAHDCGHGAAADETPSDAQQPDGCSLACCHLQAILVEGMAVGGRPTQTFSQRAIAAVHLFARQPDLPPPRRA